jgi:hypothetical protein
MSSKKVSESLTLYANFMEEIKVRVASIEAVQKGGAVTIPGVILSEFCFLQLRMICELIALGCLTAHGDIKAATKLRNDFAADKIMNQLEKLHPTFYPSPVSQSVSLVKDNIRAHHLTGITSKFLTKEELVALYRKCGNKLHKGSLKKLISAKTPIETNFLEVFGWTAKIRELLNHHTISLRDKKIVICMMVNNKTSRVQVAIAEPVDIS